MRVSNVYMGSDSINMPEYIWGTLSLENMSFDRLPCCPQIDLRRIVCPLPGQLLDDGHSQILIDPVLPGHRLRLLCAWVGIPIVTPSVAYQCATHIFECLDKFASFHSRDQELFTLADIGNFARFDVF